VESKPTEPLVSILTPYYKLGDLLIETVQSVVAQTYQNWELIIVDDCSPVSPAEAVLANFNDPRIKIFRHEENRGNAAARNTAALHSTGELLLPLDSDDLLAPNYITATLKMMLENEVSAVHTDVQIFGMHSYVYKPSANLGDIISGHYPHNTFLMKREVYDAVGGYKNIRAIVDTEFWISILEIGTKFAYLPEPLYFYRRHSDSWSQNCKSLEVEFLKVLLQHLDSTKEHLPRMLEGMIRNANNQKYKSNQKPSRRESYELLHKEFHDLLQRYESLEKKVERTEHVLASLPKSSRQFAYVALKKLGLRTNS
jgi:glycosyltransferase involved in cell wall biosynthesis